MSCAIAGAGDARNGPIASVVTTRAVRTLRRDRARIEALTVEGSW